MILEFGHQAFITVNTAFQKDLTLQGCTTLPTRTNRLLMPQWLALFLGRPTEGGCTRPLPCFRRDHESRPKDGSAVPGQIPKPVPRDVRQGWFIRGAIYPKQPRPRLPTCYDAPSPAKSFKTFSMHMSNGTLELCDSWNLLGKLANREVFQAPCGCTLVSVPKARTRVLVVASMGLEKPHPTVASHTSLSMFNLYHWSYLISIPRSPVILDSLHLIHHLDEPALTAKHG